MSEELKKLIDEHNGERTFYDGELVGVFFTAQNLENLCLEYACDKLSIKDLKIMRLREALEAVMKCEYATTEKEDYILVDDCQCLLVTIEEVLKIKQALATPTTYDDLMAWHEAQLGEPVAWLQPDTLECGIGSIDFKDTNCTPLYAKKG